MQGTLKVTPEQLDAAAGEFSTKAGDVRNITNNMTQLVIGLSSAWEGEAATAYTRKFRELDDDIQKLVRMIQEHSADLSEMAKIYREAESANENEAQALAGDVII